MKLLHCSNYIVRSNKKCTVVQLKLFYEMIYNYKVSVELRKEFEDDWFSVKFDDAKKITGYRMSNNKVMDIIDSIPCKIYYSHRDEVGWIPIFSEVKCNKEKCIIEYRIQEDARKYILELADNYSKLSIDEIVKLKGKHTQRLYELYRIYFNQKYYMIKIEDFKSLFDLDNYRTNNIIPKVIEPSIKELESIGIKISVNVIKDKVEVTHYNFNFKE